MGRARRGNSAHATAVTGRRGAGSASPYSVPDLKIQFTDGGETAGQFVIDANRKEAIDLMRNTLALGGRSLLFHGPQGSGKSLMAEQLAAILGQPLVPFVPASTADNTQEVELSVPHGRSHVLKLDAEQIQALESLKTPKVLHVQTDAPSLQALLAQAVAPDRDGLLLVKVLEGDNADEEPRYLKINSDTVIVFEVQGQGSEDSPCLEFDVMRETNPIPFPELSPYIVEAIESNGSAFMEPTPSKEIVDEQPNERPIEHVLDIARVVAAWEVIDPAREALVDNLYTHLVAVNSDVEGPEGRAFAERMISNMEIQSYDGDNRADRTVRLLAEAIFPAEQRDYAIQNQLFADVLPGLQKHSDRMFEAGEAARARANN